MTATILIVEDERPIANSVRAYLEQEGFRVEVAHDGPAGLAAARRLLPDLVILDIMLPGMDGLEVLRQLRQDATQPRLRQVYVLLLTAKSDELDKIIGLTVGADDYVTKPFSPRELVALVKARLRRGQAAAAPTNVLTFTRLRLDLDARQAWKDEAPLDLTPIEFDLLLALARHRRRVLSREQLIEQVWGVDYYGDDRVVDVHVGRLRKKVEDDPANPALVATVRGAGYRFEDLVAGS